MSIQHAKISKNVEFDALVGPMDDILDLDDILMMMMMTLFIGTSHY